MTTTPHAVQAGAGTPESDEAPAVAAARGFRDQDRNASPDSHAAGAVDQDAITTTRSLRREDRNAAPLDAVRAAVTAYHLALDQREHGGVAAGQALGAIEQALGTPWVQGKALAASATVEQLRAVKAAEQALLIVEGEDYARQYLGRLRAGYARPGELASLIGFLQGGPVLEGACRTIEKALEGQHHG